jgi:hypothetical protein
MCLSTRSLLFRPPSRLLPLEMGKSNASTLFVQCGIYSPGVWPGSGRNNAVVGALSARRRCASFRDLVIRVAKEIHVSYTDQKSLLLSLTWSVFAVISPIDFLTSLDVAGS